MSQQDRNVLLKCYKTILETVRPEECLDHLLTERIITKADVDEILGAGKLPRDRMRVSHNLTQ